MNPVQHPPTAMRPRVLAVIPARYGSTRLPGKPLLPILGGDPKIAHVVRAAQAARSVDRVMVATDHEGIAAAAERAGAQAIMTDASIATGTDRVASALRITGATADVIVNVQGDEPLMEPASIDLAANLLLAQPSAAMATLSAPLSPAALLDPHRVKVVGAPIEGAHAIAGGARAAAEEGIELSAEAIRQVSCARCSMALYFSRTPIGVGRQALDSMLRPSRGDTAITAPQPGSYACRLHVGLYAFRPASLQRFVSLPPSALERMEQLEQLRALEDGMRIVVGEVDAPVQGIDTIEDVQLVEELGARVTSSA